jgi:hypothetical protein
MSGWTKNDLEPPLKGIVLDGDVPVDLSDAVDVSVNIRRFDRSIISRSVVPGDQETSPGSFSMDWQEGDLSVEGACISEIDVEQPIGRHRRYGTATFAVSPGVI